MSTHRSPAAAPNSAASRGTFARLPARLSRCGLVAAAALLAAACGSLGSIGEPAPSSPAAPELPPSATRPGKSAPAPKAAGRRGPHADARIELAGRCNQVDVDGFGENAILDVRNNTVTALNWSIKVGRKGTCTFKGTDFRQTKSRPHIELVSRDGSGCKLMIWQEPRRVTLGHQGCARWCSPASISEDAYPVMFDPRTGGCARLG
jgi:hypothetical protein